MNKETFDYTNKMKFQQIILEQKLKWEKANALNKVNDTQSKIEESNLKEVKGIGDKTMGVLIQNGITTVDKLRNNLENLGSFGLSPIAIAQIKNYFKEAN